ncbi:MULTISPECIES: GNAT family N-acetyltransferase [Clostridia]|uniref:GNAT family N-acetyltransferase n=1 Tax=Clostridia TaxID=186801 RepID=UPI000EA1931B|nr:MULTISPECIES: GNAT family N-acetyltransferase [Clostridia]NBJ68084.1 N-acetyltransferase [Roseburia sp. 1XD42-34]RKI81860.1 N-acetyltransferase [Clostridium sp. 1xD42-85]
MENNIQIQTKRLQLVPCTEKLVRAISNSGESLGNHIYYHLQKLIEDQTQLGWGPWIIFEQKSSQMIGDAGFKGKPNVAHVVEIGYGIMDFARNQGYATEAVEALIKWSFTSSYVDKVIAECLVANLPSIKVLEKVGMSRIAVEENLLKWEISRMSVTWL